MVSPSPASSAACVVDGGSRDDARPRSTRPDATSSPWLRFYWPTQRWRSEPRHYLEARSSGAFWSKRSFRWGPSLSAVSLLPHTPLIGLRRSIWGLTPSARRCARLWQGDSGLAVAGGARRRGPGPGRLRRRRRSRFQCRGTTSDGVEYAAALSTGRRRWSPF